MKTVKKLPFNNAWIDFWQEIKAAHQELDFKEGEECFYRGHINSSYQLTPGLFRGVPGNKKEMPDNLWEAEYAMFFEFQSRAKDVHQGPVTDWDVLFYMQHHGCKTRLLDWTENFGVALYFSLLESAGEGKSPTIWLLNAYALNEKYHGYRDLYSPEYLDTEDEESYSDLLVNGDDFWWDEPIGLYPVRRVDRLTSQGGYFTVHGNDIRPLNEVVPENKRFWKKVVLTPAGIKDAKDFLSMAGINAYTLFPDLDGLSKYLNGKYFNK